MLGLKQCILSVLYRYSDQLHYHGQVRESANYSRWTYLVVIGLYLNLLFDLLVPKVLFDFIQKGYKGDMNFREVETFLNISC
jgi:hypothetical protein